MWYGIDLMGGVLMMMFGALLLMLPLEDALFVDRVFGPGVRGFSRAFGAIMLLAGLAISVNWIYRAPTQEAIRQRLRHVLRTPEAQILSLRLVPTAYGSLVSEPLEVSDRHHIAKVAAALNQAQRFDPNHPSRVWAVMVEMTTAEGSVAFTVCHTAQRENGTFVQVYTHGWNSGAFRADELGTILESIANEAEPKE